MWTALAFLLALSPAERRLHEESFELVWQTVREQHWDVQRVGTSWEQERHMRRKQLARARSVAEMRRITQLMLHSLGQSHFQVLTSGNHLPEPQSGRGDTGLRFELVEQRPTVVEVEAASPAALAGVRPGWVLNQPDGRELTGPIEKSVRAEFEDAGGERHLVTLTRRVPRGHAVQLGNLPEERVWIETTPAAPQIGRIRFNAFLDPERLMPAIEQAVRACAGCRGFVLDLRGNPGGLAAMATGVAGWFVREAGQRLGTLRARARSEEFEVRPRVRAFTGRLAILVDSGSASTSEILAAGLQDLGRARLFGAQTAGAALPSQIIRLPNGDAFQFATATYISQSGRMLEGKGVTPDEVVPRTRAALAAGIDEPLDAALRWIATP